jgi:hypothetical protein
MTPTRYGALRDTLLGGALGPTPGQALLRDGDSHYIPVPISERLVQCIWYDQRLRAPELRTTAGEPVAVVFPGWWNLEAGPDFKHATLRIGNAPEQTGAVEIHLRAEDWFHHGHERDPLYDEVILHVVLWESGSRAPARTVSGRVLPQLVLEHLLDAPLERLHDEIDTEGYPHAALEHEGRCAEAWRALPAESVGRLLESAGDERFAAKSRRYQRWIHRAGADQAFYEAWMEALGYKANKSGFRALAQRLPLAEALALARGHAGDAALAAALFGVANLLPTGRAQARDTAGRRQLKRLWNTWWKLRPEFQDRVLAADAWRFHAVRPANHPHRRLGAAAALLRQHPNLLEKIIGALETGGDPARLFVGLRDEYWARHCTLGGAAQPRAQDLIGAGRARELLTNVLLPFALARAGIDGNDKLAAAAWARYAALRPAPGNSLARLAGQRLFGPERSARKLIRTERQQQGLLQVFQDFCLRDKSACRNCLLPELVRQWR